MTVEIETRCAVCSRPLAEHALVEARTCLEVLGAEALALAARACGGATPAALARMRG